MDILLTARHFDMSDGLRDYARRRFDRLQRYHDRLARVEVTLLDEKRQKRVEAMARIDGDVDLHAEASADDFRAALSSASDKLARQLKRRNDRQRDHRAPRLGRDIEPIEPGEGSDV